MAQMTFGSIVGMESTLPTASHPSNEYLCEDTGEYRLRDEVLFSYDGKAWSDSEERYDYEATALVELAETLLEWVDDYVDHDDSISAAVYPAFGFDQTWREYIADYYRDDCDDCTGHTDAEFETICDTLRDGADAMMEINGYSTFDYDLTSYDVGEINEQIDINDHPILKALHERGDLEGILDSTECGHEFVSFQGKFVSGGKYPCLDLMLASDKTYWWGYSHEEMEEVYHDIVDSED
jgi:hypothetical protein